MCLARLIDVMAGFFEWHLITAEIFGRHFDGADLFDRHGQWFD